MISNYGCFLPSLQVKLALSIGIYLFYRFYTLQLTVLKVKPELEY
jgi:hypothetical protein